MLKKVIGLTLLGCFLLSGCQENHLSNADILVYPNSTNIFPNSTESVDYQTVERFDDFIDVATDNSAALLVINATDKASVDNINVDSLKEMLGSSRVLYVYYTDPYTRIGFEELWEGEKNFVEVAEDMPVDKREQVIPDSGFCVFDVIQTENGTALYRRNIFLANAQSVDDLKQFSTCDAITSLTQDELNSPQ